MPVETTKHTPGPWKAHMNCQTAIVPGHLIKAQNLAETPVALLWEGGGTNGKPMQEANAHLMAAAPELLAYAEAEAQLSQHMISCNECDAREGEDGECPAYRKLYNQLNPGELRRAAIKKAKGE